MTSSSFPLWMSHPRSQRKPSGKKANVFALWVIGHVDRGHAFLARLTVAEAVAEGEVEDVGVVGLWHGPLVFQPDVGP